MQAFLLILSLAIIVEALVQYAKTVITMLENKQYKTFGTQLAAILIAVFICFAAGAMISRNCFGTPAPILTPLPPAKIIAIFIYCFLLFSLIIFMKPDCHLAIPSQNVPVYTYPILHRYINIITYSQKIQL